jgi:hypothetical protein
MVAVNKKSLILNDCILSNLLFQITSNTLKDIKSSIDSISKQAVMKDIQTKQ